MALPTLITDFNKQNVNYGMAVGQSLAQLGQRVRQSLAQEEYQRQAQATLPMMQKQLSDSINKIGSGDFAGGYGDLTRSIMSNPQMLMNPYLAKYTEFATQAAQLAGSQYANSQVPSQSSNPIADLLMHKMLGDQGRGSQPAPAGTTAEDINLTGEMPDQIPTNQQSAPAKTPAAATKVAAKKIAAGFQALNSGGIQLGQAFKGAQSFIPENAIPQTGGRVVPLDNLSKLLPGVTGAFVANPGFNLSSINVGGKTNSFSFTQDKKSAEDANLFVRVLAEDSMAITGQRDIMKAINNVGGDIRNLTFSKTPDKNGVLKLVVGKKEDGSEETISINKETYDRIIRIGSAPVNVVPLIMSAKSPAQQGQSRAQELISIAKSALQSRGESITTDNIINEILALFPDEIQR